LETTLAIIAENGLESVTMRGIGHRLGVSEAAPYHHFENKAQLLSMLAADAYSSFHQALLRALDEAGADPFDRLLGFARAYVSYGLESRGRFRLMFGEQMLELRKYPHVLAAARPTRELLTEIAAACADKTPFFEFTYWALGHRARIGRSGGTNGLCNLVAHRRYLLAAVTTDSPIRGTPQSLATGDIHLGVKSHRRHLLADGDRCVSSRVSDA
jgi:AcrR family transcriptional regulator